MGAVYFRLSWTYTHLKQINMMLEILFPFGGDDFTISGSFSLESCSFLMLIVPLRFPFKMFSPLLIVRIPAFCPGFDISSKFATVSILEAADWMSPLISEIKTYLNDTFTVRYTLIRQCDYTFLIGIRL